MLPLPTIGATLLAFDTGSRTGWAAYDRGRLTSGVVKLPVDPPGKRWSELRRLLVAVKNGVPEVHAVYYERSTFVGGHGNAALAAMDRGGCYAVLEAWAYHHQLPLIGVAPAQAKKALTGNGKADKAEMIARASQLAGEVIADHNRADAVGVMVYALDHYQRYQRRAA